MRRIIPTTLVLLIGLAVLAPAASAHVTVNPNEAKQGGFAKLTFRVPNERASAGTTKVEVFFPADQPIPNVSVKPTPGFTSKVEKTKLATPIQGESSTISEAVSKITWEGGPIKPGEFNEFDVSVGPLPKDATSMVFKAIQYYEGGDIVRWIDEPAAGAEPEHPAPVLKLVPATATTATTATTASSGSTASSTTVTTAATGGQSTATLELAGSAKDKVDRANLLAVAALIIGALGLVAAGLAIVRSRPRTPSP
jgi:uncharacterized protein YcnI